MVITVTEIFLLCWAGLVTGLYFSERSKRKQQDGFVKFVLEGIVKKTLHISEDANGRIHVSKTS